MKANNRYFITEAEGKAIRQSKRPIAWFVWALLVILPPVGVFLLWKRKGRTKAWVKVLLTIACLCWIGPYLKILLSIALFFHADRIVGVFRF